MCTDVTFLDAEHLYENNKYSQALDAFKNLEGAETNCNILNYIGCCYLKLGLFDEAKQIFQSLIVDYPIWACPVYNLGRVFLQQEKMEIAFQYFQKAVKLAPNDDNPYFYFGVYYEKLKDFNNAIKFYKQAIDMNYSEYESHLNLSVCFKQIGDIHGAIQEAKIAFKLFDNNDTLYNLTYFLNIIGDYENVFNLLMDRKVFDGEDEGLIINLLYSTQKLNNIDMCLKCADRVLELNPENIIAKKALKQYANQNL